MSATTLARTRKDLDSDEALNLLGDATPAGVRKQRIRAVDDVLSRHSRLGRRAE